MNIGGRRIRWSRLPCSPAISFCLSYPPSSPALQPSSKRSGHKFVVGWIDFQGGQDETSIVHTLMKVVTIT